MINKDLQVLNIQSQFSNQIFDTNLKDKNISIESILQIPENNTFKEYIPIIIITHETTKKLLIEVLNKIEKLDFVFNKVTVINIDKSIE